MSENSDFSWLELPSWPLVLVLMALLVGQILGVINLYQENKQLAEVQKTLVLRLEQTRNMNAILRSVSQEILDLSKTNSNAEKLRVAFNIRMQEPESTSPTP